MNVLVLKTLNDIVTLKVPKDENDKKEKERVYKYSELVDLNDKLTLVVGKDDQQQEVIRYFADVSGSAPGVGFTEKYCLCDRSFEPYHNRTEPQ